MWMRRGNMSPRASNPRGSCAFPYLKRWKPRKGRQWSSASPTPPEPPKKQLTTISCGPGSSMEWQFQRHSPTSSKSSAETPTQDTITVWPWATRNTTASSRQTKDIYNVALSSLFSSILRCCDNNRPALFKFTRRRSNGSLTSRLTTGAKRVG